MRRHPCLVAPYTNRVQKPCSSFQPRKHHQYSTMKFTSLTTIVISAASMVGIAIASEDSIIIIPQGPPEGLPCSPKGEHSCSLRADLRTRTVQCSKGYPSYNDNYDFAFYCGDYLTIERDMPCSCHNCCEVSHNKQGYECKDVSLSSHDASGVRVLSGRERCDLVSIWH
ncbi:uncharacterized protein EDB93DRAFT_1153002 [Suillus bovinus]|uniref:uncharacterized protein n=1 Tax=Suillus bovinus TaxID=48563 RepID=UPI001B87BE8B|nr:uncharacterized protein EDB93DRAFT_1153002 [Suillus bovinus]KAG2144358.1 hypothetical protein EDB93DRAFT_1153002 [Suillus bovinus]